MNDLSFFEQLPMLGPINFRTELQNEFDHIISGMNQIMKFNSVYPYDIYNIIENGKRTQTVIEIAAAGFSKDQCNVTVKGNQLTVQIGIDKKKKDKEIAKETTIVSTIRKEYVVNKMAMRSARYSWTLSPLCDLEHIEVKYENGVLIIILPMTQPIEPEEKIINIQ